tara:strand:- start:1443 stop:2117 length:675 start_codon:yes stop_codon:yes gene_type:complete
MSVDEIHLRKLLQLFDAPANKRQSLLREEIRQEIRRKQGLNTGGQDFYGPFWADAKKYVSEGTNLNDQTAFRVGRNDKRARLYPLLKTGFLDWWENKRRWRNEPFEFLQMSVNSRFEISELNAVVKVQNLLALGVGSGGTRIIYPYFSEVPSLSADTARIGLWVLKESLPDFAPEDMRILDILRSRSFAISDVPFRGNEREICLRTYRKVLFEWERLSEEYLVA